MTVRYQAQGASDMKLRCRLSELANRTPTVWLSAALRALAPRGLAFWYQQGPLALSRGRAASEQAKGRAKLSERGRHS